MSQIPWTSHYLKWQNKEKNPVLILLADDIPQMNLLGFASLPARRFQDENGILHCNIEILHKRDHLNLLEDIKSIFLDELTKAVFTDFNFDWYTTGAHPEKMIHITIRYTRDADCTFLEASVRSIRQLLTALNICWEDQVLIYRQLTLEEESYIPDGGSGTSILEYALIINGLKSLPVGLKIIDASD
jgi:hypothetical protein